MPWKPVETLQQARALNRFGTIGLAVLARIYLVGAIGNAGQSQGRPLALLFMLAAFGSGASAFGTNRNSRAAALFGFVLSFLGIFYLAPLFGYAAVKAVSATKRLSGGAKP
jgi:hypothetical protein